MSAMSATGHAVLVLGMHRSGTSCLAGSLQQAGLELGRVFTSNPFNVKGNREHRDVMELNDDVLQYSGGAWDSPPRSLQWTEEHGRRRDRFFADLAERSAGSTARRLIGFKDPRSLLTIEFWRESLVPLRFVGTYRHPAQVARSLASRNGLTTAQSLSLWRQYNEHMLALHAEAPFPIVSFDAPAADYIARVQQVIEGLGLDMAREVFFDDALRRPVAPEVAARPLPDDIATLYARLLAVS